MYELKYTMYTILERISVNVQLWIYAPFITSVVKTVQNNAWVTLKKSVLFTRVCVSQRKPLPFQKVFD